MNIYLTDAEVEDVTRRRQPCAQARVLTRMGVPFKKRADGTLLVGRAALDRTLTGGAQSDPANGIKWSRAA